MRIRSVRITEPWPTSRYQYALNECFGDLALVENLDFASYRPNDEYPANAESPASAATASADGPCAILPNGQNVVTNWRLCTKVSYGRGT